MSIDVLNDVYIHLNTCINMPVNICVHEQKLTCKYTFIYNN